MQAYRFPSDCTAVIDVTKPPYNLDNTGKEDCTVGLRKIVDDIMSAYEAEFYKTKAKIEAMEDHDALISFEIRKVNG